MFKGVIRLLRGVTFVIARLSPNLEYDLRQADIAEDVTIYLATAMFQSIMLFLMFSAGVYVILSNANSPLTYIAPIAGAAIGIFSLYSSMNRPKMKVRRRVDEIERHLVFTIQSLFIQVSSGTPVYDAMVSIAMTGQGATSNEFKRAVEEIRSGKPVEFALEDLASRNPSPYFQKTIWQMVNTIKTGGDMRDLLKDMTERLAQDQINTAKSFGAKLSPISMAYMLAAVIIPSLGTTVLITISSLPNMGGKITEQTFWLILGLTIFIQVQFAMIIRSARPSIIGE
jgi:Flp pilus assembly protein TadB